MHRHPDETVDPPAGATVQRLRLGLAHSPAGLLRTIRNEPGLFALIGAWAGSRAIIGWRPSRTLSPDDDPFEAISHQREVRAGATFGAGWVGALGYRLGQRLESLPAGPPRPVPSPDFALSYYDRALVLDDAGWWLEGLTESEDGADLAAEARAVEDLVRGKDCPDSGFACGVFDAVPDDEGHAAAIEATLKHLAAGDIYQANICRRLGASFDGDPLDLFCRAVESLSPGYAAFLRTRTGAIASLSPELFLRRRGRMVSSAPIKGTAPLDSNVDELVASAKNRAENVMIVDLMRNDLGRVCVPGSVRVEELARAEAHTGVWHLVSDVVGELEAGTTDGDLLRATFPPGSVTGAPKVRAMQVISALEATGREAYTGAIGYVSPLAGLELNVAIRTFEFASGRVWLGVGGGVVIDSTPEGEVAETLVKALPLLSAIGATLDPHAAAATAPELTRSPRVTRIATVVDTPPVDLQRGVFTTMLVRDGHAVDLGSHLARLETSARSLYGEGLPSELPAELAAHLMRLEGSHRLRVTVTPLGATLRGAIASSPLMELPREAVRLTARHLPGGLGQHKYADRRRLEAVPTPIDRQLLIDADGTILETGSGNLFLVGESFVVTPPLDGRILPGVTRQRVIDELQRAGIPVQESRVELEDLGSGIEAFVTSSVVRVRRVESVAGIASYQHGLLSSWLRDRLAATAPSVQVPVPPPLPAARRRTPVRLLLIDNYDSFVYNLDQLLRELGALTEVVRNDAVSLAQVEAALSQHRYDGIVLSPGPGRPTQAGISTDLVRRFGSSIPLLGVCLGHQCIAEAYGAMIVSAPTILHGKQSIVHHGSQGVFRQLNAPTLVARYHSLVVDESSLPAVLEVTARSGDGTVMGLRHREHPVEGVQFHPESFLTEHGRHLLTAFLADCVPAAGESA